MMSLKNNKKKLQICGSMLLAGMFLIPLGFSSCGKSGTPIEQLQDSLRQQGDSIVAVVDTTRVLTARTTPEGTQLQSVSLDKVGDSSFGTVSDFTATDSIVVFIAKDGDRNIVKSIDLQTLAANPIGKPAEKITFNKAKDSLIFVNSERKVMADLTGKFNLEKEPGVTDACMKTFRRVNNYTDDSAGYWGYMYNKPVNFIGLKGKFTGWDGSNFHGFIKTDEGIIVFKRNGDTYLNDEKIGTTKISVSRKYISEDRYNTKDIVTAKFTGIDGSEYSFTLTNLSFTP